MVKITRTSTKIPPPPKSFYLMVMLLFVFPVFPRSRGACCRAQGLTYCPSYSARWRLPPHKEGFIDFGWGKGKPFPVTFQEIVHWPPLNTPAVFFIPSPLNRYLYQSQLCPQQKTPSPLALTYVASRANRNLLQRGPASWDSKGIQEVRS